MLLDNTWATPLFFQPLEHGVDLSIQAATKYIGGHADVMLGYVTANESHASAAACNSMAIWGSYASGDDAILAPARPAHAAGPAEAPSGNRR